MTRPVRTNRKVERQELKGLKLAIHYWKLLYLTVSSAWCCLSRWWKETCSSRCRGWTSLCCPCPRAVQQDGGHWLALHHRMLQGNEVQHYGRIVCGSWNKLKVICWFCSYNHLLRADLHLAEAKLLETIFKKLFVARKMELASKPSCFIFLLTFVELVMDFWSWNVLGTKTNHFVKCTLLVHWRKHVYLSVNVHFSSKVAFRPLYLTRQVFTPVKLRRQW